MVQLREKRRIRSDKRPQPFQVVKPRVDADLVEKGGEVKMRSGTASRDIFFLLKGGNVFFAKNDRVRR
jgi:hypothetical protein